MAGLVSADSVARLPPILAGQSTPDMEERVERFRSSVAAIFETWVKRRQSRHTRRAYREDVMAFAALSVSPVRHYSTVLGFKIGAHALRTTAATNALEHGSDIAKVQQWLGHANITTTRLYDRRDTKPEDSPTVKVPY